MCDLGIIVTSYISPLSHHLVVPRRVNTEVARVHRNLHAILSFYTQYCNHIPVGIMRNVAYVMLLLQVSLSLDRRLISVADDPLKV